MRKKVVFLPYDFDTALGINNEGSLVFSYNLEDIDQTQGGADVFNGQESVLWKNVRAAFSKELAAMYRTLRSTGALSYSKVERMFEEHQEKWGEAVFNEDAYFKYLAPLIEDGDGAYLSMLQGSKAEQRKWWLYNRFRYMDSKYNAGDALSDVIQLRGYEKANVTVTPYADVYASVKYGSYLVQERGTRNVATTLICPLDNVNDTEIYIYSASQLASVGDLSGLKVGFADFSLATKLQSIKVGDNTGGYTNGNLTELHLGNNVLLRTLDVRNCTALGTGDQKAVDVSGCTNIEHVYFDGTAVTGVSLPNGGILKTLHLPATVTSLVLRNQQAVTDLTVASYTNVTTLWIDSSSVDARPILAAIPANARVRITGFTWEVANAAAIDTIYDILDTMRGLDEYGGNMEPAQVSGTIHLSSISGADLAALQPRYPYVTIRADHVESTLTYKTWDGGSTVSTVTCIDGVPQSAAPSGPARTATERNRYSFVGWNTSQDAETATANYDVDVYADKTVYAAYARTPLTYLVYKTYDGSETLKTVTCTNGAPEESAPSGPARAATERNRYAFAGWSTAQDAESGTVGYDSGVTEDRTVYAAYSHTALTYLSYYSYNGLTRYATVTCADGVPEDAAPQGVTRTSDAQYSYTHVGWSTSQNAETATAGCEANVTEDRSIYAAFSKTLRTYTVTWRNSDNTVLETDTDVPYGTTPTYDGQTPQNPASGGGPFQNWEPAVAAVTGDATYTANYTVTYTVYFYNGQTLLQTVTGVAAGGSAAYTGATPTDGDNVFTGWSPQPTNIQGDTSCYAQFTAPSAGVPTATTADGAYGVEWDYENSSSAVTRKGLATSFSAPAPAESTSDSGSSPFDTIAPWKDMKRFCVINGNLIPDTDPSYDETNYDTLVYIPEFYYTAYKDTAISKWLWAISPTALPGYVKHPGSGRYVGRFHTGGSSSGVYSKGGVAPLVNTSQTSFRQYSAAKGTGWGMMDLATWSAIQMLYLVEYADFDSQAKLGSGFAGVQSSVGTMGATGAATYHTLKISSGHNMYRWIEDPFSNCLDWIDGFLGSTSAAYAGAAGSYAGNTSGLENLGFALPSGNYITGFGYSEKAPWAFIPDAASSSSESYVRDKVWSGSSLCPVYVGGDYISHPSYGLWYFSADYAASSSYAVLGSRLQKT